MRDYVYEQDKSPLGVSNRLINKVYTRAVGRRPLGVGWGGKGEAEEKSWKGETRQEEKEEEW